MYGYFDVIVISRKDSVDFESIFHVSFFDNFKRLGRVYWIISDGKVVRTILIIGICSTSADLINF